MLKTALKKPVTIVVAIAATLIFSVLALLRIPIDIFPNLNLPTIYIAQPYGGMTAAQMEGFVATRYQNQMLYVSGIKDVEVKNIQGLCLVKCTFYENADMAQVSGEVANQVNRVMNYMPPGTVPPTVVRFDASSLPVGQLVFSSQRATLGELQDLASTRIRPLFSQIPGASAPSPFGGNERTVVVRVDPEKMRSYEFTPDDIVSAVVENNKIAPAGNIRIGDYTVVTPSNTVIENVEEFLGIPLRKGAGPTVFMRDVATVEDATDVPVGYALVNGKRAVYIPVTKTAGASTMNVVNALKEKLPEMQNLIPADVKLSYEFDQSVYVMQSVHSLAVEGGLGALLTGLMVFLFLRDLKSSLIVIITIPISILAAILLLQMTGQTINMMTLSGLALAIGILVDQSTVVIENIHQHLEMDKSKARAIRDASKELSFPLLLITFSIIAVFAPAFLMTGIPGGMFLPISLAVGFSILVSYILSQTLVPILSNWWLKDHHNQKASAHPEIDSEPATPAFMDRVKDSYVSMLNKLIKIRRSVILIYIGVCMAVVGVGFMLIGQDMMPRQDRSRQFQVRLVGPQGLRVERMEDRVKLVLAEIAKLVDGKQNIGISSAFVGTTPSSYGTSALYVFNSGPHEAVLQVNLAATYHLASLDGLKEQIRKAVKKAVPDIELSFEPIELTEKIMSQGASTPIEVVVAGKDIDESEKHARKLIKAMGRIDYLRDVRIKQPLRYPTVQIQIDRQRAAQLGLGVAEISRSLVAATASSRFTAKNLWLDQSKGFAYQVQVEISPQYMQSVADIQSIPMVKGQLRPTLGDVATITPANMPGQYDRTGPRRLVTVSANIHQKDLGTATSDVQKAIASVGEAPRGSVVELQGMAQLLTETMSSLQFGLVLAIIVIFLLLAANYQSFMVAGIVLITIPAVLSGSILFLLLTGQTLNLQSYMGIIMSVGVSVANALLLVTNAETLRIQYRDATAAARVAGSVRLRPILMTTFAMVAGMIPMASGLGETGEHVAPLGRAVIGGLIASTFATLFIVPVAFSLFLRKQTFDSASLDPDDPESTVYDPAEEQAQQTY
ncbi:AcrB/AcrD/AcrF family protein [Dyadobacter luteus]|uniref:AcrB/AcrD/AcrF family protein n=1 Tax=Dyadobacter luteus TaxID=2259619 RepID=A0A3D8YE97_9BACT|nr:efflux RND transporter permease subunit [Dyadobacter luteus]REA62812.1 AcrB/AcrD/AcrF family protein [Dyadobacter luteus]